MITKALIEELLGIAVSTGSDFAERFAALHEELCTLNAEAATLAKKIDVNFKELMG